MGNLLINVLLSVLFGIVIFIILLRKSNLKVEHILIPIITGLFAVFPASLLEYELFKKTGSADDFFNIFINAFVIASLIEETAKFLAIKILFSIRKIDNLKAGISTAIAVGTGFACLENILYSFDSSIFVKFRVFSAIPLHIITAGIMGYFCVKTVHSQKYRSLRGFCEAFLIHGFYNLLISIKTFISFLAIPLLLCTGYRLYKLLSKNSSQRSKTDINS